MIDSLLAQLRAYKKKYYLNRLIGGGLVSFGLVLSAFILVNTVEFFGRFDSITRAALFYGWLALLVVVTFRFVLTPIFKLATLDKALSDEEAAQQIGKYFPEISDKLLNTLQLSRMSAGENALIKASIAQRTKALSVIPFTKAIDYKQNKRFWPYIIPPVGLAVVLLLFIPQLFSEGTERLVQYNRVFVPKAPFRFVLKNKELSTFIGEDFEVQLAIEGDAIPEQVYIENGGRLRKMEQDAQGNYLYRFGNLQKPEKFNFQAAGFSSEAYEIMVMPRPALLQFTTRLVYPAYLNKQNEKLDNTGNLTVPAGTRIEWEFDARDTDSLLLAVNEQIRQAEKKGSSSFVINERALKSFNYTLQLKNRFARNPEDIKYQIDVIADEYPKLQVQQQSDSSLFNYLLLGGNLSDDYGITRAEVFFRIYNKNLADQADKYPFRGRKIRVTPNSTAQRFFYNLPLDSLNIQPNDVVEYYVSVWDNDGVAGPKATKSGVMKMRVPDAKALEEAAIKKAENNQRELNEQAKRAQELKKDVAKLQQRMKTKRNLEFQDRKAIEELLKKQEDLRKEVEKMQEENKMLNEQQNRFDKPNENIAQKLESLQKLMDELLDPETKKLYEQLRQLLDDKMQRPDQIQQVLEKIEKKENNLSKELDRALEMFKQMQMEMRMNKAIEKLDELAKKQEQLAQKTESKSPENKKDNKDNKANNKDSKENKDAKDSKDNKESKDSKDNKDSKDGKENKDSKDSKENKDSKDSKDSKENKDSKDKNSPDNNQKEDDNKNNKESEGNQKEDALKQEQEKLAEEFKEWQEEQDKLEELNKSLENPQDMPNTEEQEKQIEQDQKESQQNLQQNKKQQAAKKQRDASKKMKEMAQQMKSSMMQQEAEENEENAEALRQILENLLKLSFDQEDLMKESKRMYPSDPRFPAYGQKQLQIRDNAKIIEDSLTALAKRVHQISSFITRELADMNGYMEESTNAIKQKRADLAAGKQQFAMTSMNNLALLLSDVLKQMQDEMQNQNGSAGGKKKKKSKKPQPGNMSQMQKELSQKIQDLKNSGKSGKALSEELAQMAAQQEALRRALQELEKQSMEKGEKSGGLNQIKDLMEKSEQDLVNKRLTQELINRQQEIVTRLLESEKSMREREQDEKRESKTAKEFERKLPPSFEEYLRKKEQQVELLKTIPPNLAPFYKQETNRYFQQLGGGSGNSNNPLR